MLTASRAHRYTCARKQRSVEARTMTPELTIVIPTYNERENIPLVIAEVKHALAGVAWEMVFVDDDSPDGTASVIAKYARECTGVRLLHRIGRRGLSSASIEGMMASQAPLIAVMDADLQHDAAILPLMLMQLRQESLDLVIGTRNAAGGSMGQFGPTRVLLSRVGQMISRSVCHCDLSDPMSGFFMLRRGFLMEVVHDLRGEGFKILVDLLASSRRPVRLAEIGYTFKTRAYGESKLDAVTGIEYLFLILNKLIGDVIPVQLTLYFLVGCVGLIAYLVCSTLLVDVLHVHFVAAQMIATFLAMTENFLLNNILTFRDRKLRGRYLLPGALRFIAACSFGAWANVVFSRALWQSGVEWMAAGFAGIVMGSVWNLSVSSFVTWPVRLRPGRSGARAAVLDTVKAIP